MWAQAGQFPEGGMSREGEEWHSSKGTRTRGELRAASCQDQARIFQGPSLSRVGVDGGSGSSKEVERDKETEPGLSHVEGERGLGAPSGRGGPQRASGRLRAAFPFGVLSPRCLWPQLVCGYGV